MNLYLIEIENGAPYEDHEEIHQLKVFNNDEEANEYALKETVYHYGELTDKWTMCNSQGYNPSFEVTLIDEIDGHTITIS